MRMPVDEAKLHAFIDEIGRRATGPGRVYLVGGATALLLGLRQQTVDIDLKLDPEPTGIFEAIALLKSRLDLNIELSAPDQFVPPLPGWVDRSEFIARRGEVEFYHYDYYGQALAKISRGYRQDLADAAALVKLGKVNTTKLSQLLEQVKPALARYPALDPKELEAQLISFVEGL